MIAMLRPDGVNWIMQTIANDTLYPSYSVKREAFLKQFDSSRFAEKDNHLLIESDNNFNYATQVADQLKDVPELTCHIVTKAEIGWTSEDESAKPFLREWMKYTLH